MNKLLLYWLLLLIFVTTFQLKGSFSANENASISTKTNIRFFHHKAGFHKFHFIGLDKTQPIKLSQPKIPNLLS